VPVHGVLGRLHTYEFSPKFCFLTLRNRPFGLNEYNLQRIPSIAILGAQLRRLLQRYYSVEDPQLKIRSCHSHQPGTANTLQEKAPSYGNVRHEVHAYEPIANRPHSCNFVDSKFGTFVAQIEHEKTPTTA